MLQGVVVVVVGGGRRGRGRGGRGRGVAAGAPLNEVSDSGSSVGTDRSGRTGSTDNSFSVVSDSDEEVDENAPPPPPPLPDVPDPFVQIPAMGNPEHSHDHQFQPGFVENGRTLEFFWNMSPTDIVLHLASPFFNVLIDCSNAAGPNINLSMKDMYTYHAALTLGVHMGGVPMYGLWREQPLFQFTGEAAKLQTLLPLYRFKYIRSNLRGYRPEDDVPVKTRSWKIDRAWEAVKKEIENCLSCPGEFLSADEGMAQGSSKRNPIYVSLGKAKPLEGYRFFILVDYKTKVIIAIILDNKILTKENCENRPGGFAGAVIDLLCQNLPGRWYKVMADNYYNTLALALHMMNNRSVLVGGTMQRKHTPRGVYIGSAKKPKPSQRNPKGSLKMVKATEGPVYFYSWMDSSLCYFIDPMYGPGQPDVIHRKKSDGTRQAFQVPKLITAYNKYMHAVDVFDQIRKLFGCDVAHRTLKWTVRMFEIFWSIILAQSYNIYRHLWDRNPQKRLGHREFQASVISGLLGHHTVQPPVLAPVLHAHTMIQQPEGSRGDGSRRRKCLQCRMCPKSISGAKQYPQTTYICQQCNVGLHPCCFDAYHRTLPAPAPSRTRHRPNTPEG